MTATITSISDEPYNPTLVTHSGDIRAYWIDYSKIEREIGCSELTNASPLLTVDAAIDKSNRRRGLSRLIATYEENLHRLSLLADTVPTQKDTSAHDDLETSLMEQQEILIDMAAKYRSRTITDIKSKLELWRREVGVTENNYDLKTDALVISVITDLDLLFNQE